jgi:hypothetical protein
MESLAAFIQRYSSVAVTAVDSWARSVACSAVRGESGAASEERVRFARLDARPDLFFWRKIWSIHARILHHSVDKEVRQVSRYHAVSGHYALFIGNGRTRLDEAPNRNNF